MDRLEERGEFVRRLVRHVLVRVYDHDRVGVAIDAALLENVGFAAHGEAERRIQTALHEWAYMHVYDNADQRGAYLPYWLQDYNWHRPHASLEHNPPISRLKLAVNNVVGLHRSGAAAPWG